MVSSIVFSGLMVREIRRPVVALSCIENNKKAHVNLPVGHVVLDLIFSASGVFGRVAIPTHFQLDDRRDSAGEANEQIEPASADTDFLEDVDTLFEGRFEICVKECLAVFL